MKRYSCDTIISRMDSRNHLVGKCKRITTDTRAAGLLGGVDFVEDVTFDMATTGRVVIEKNGITYVAKMAKRSARWCIDFIYLLCRSDDVEWAKYEA